MREHVIGVQLLLHASVWELRWIRILLGVLYQNEANGLTAETSKVPQTHWEIEKVCIPRLGACVSVASSLAGLHKEAMAGRDGKPQDTNSRGYTHP